MILDRPVNYLDLYKEEDITKLPSLTIKQITRDCVDIFLEVKGVTRALKNIFQKYGLVKKSASRNSRNGIFNWTHAGFNSWLTNPVLCGHTAYHKRISIDKGKWKRTKPSDWQIIYDTHLEHRLITEEEAAEIKRIIELNAKLGNFNFNPNPNISEFYGEHTYQSGIVFCDDCGSKCISKTSNCKSGMYSYFGCRYSGMGCGNTKSTRKKVIEDALIKTLVQRSQSLASESDQQLSGQQEKSDRLKVLETRLEALDNISGFDLDIEKLKEKTRQQIAEEIDPFRSDSILNRSTEEIIRAGNNLAIWHTLSSDDKVKIYHQIVHQITIRNKEVKKIILKI